MAYDITDPAAVHRLQLEGREKLTVAGVEAVGLSDGGGAGCGGCGGVRSAAAGAPPPPEKQTADPCAGRGVSAGGGSGAAVVCPAGGRGRAAAGDAQRHGAGCAAVCAGAVAAAAAVVGLLAGRSGGHGAPSVVPCVVDGGAGEKNRRCREKSLSFSPQVRYDKEKDGEGGEHTWHRRKKQRTAPAPPWCC